MAVCFGCRAFEIVHTVTFSCLYHDTSGRVAGQSIWMVALDVQLPLSTSGALLSRVFRREQNPLGIVSSTLLFGRACGPRVADIEPRGRDPAKYSKPVS